MTTNPPLRIHLERTAKAGNVLNFKLSDDFFKGLDQQEILGGDVDLNVHVKDHGSHVFILFVEAHGKVTVMCDRCLDPVELAVETSDEFRVLKWGEAVTDDIDESCMEERDGMYDVSWNAYEAIELSLPMVRQHPEGCCNAEMVEKLQAYSRTSDEI